MEFYLAMILSVLFDMQPRQTKSTRFCALVFAVIAVIEGVKELWALAS